VYTLPDSTMTFAGSNIAQTISGNNTISGANDITGDNTISGANTFSGENNFTAKQFFNESSDADVTIGLSINQGANDDAVLSFKSSDISNTHLTIESDTYGQFKKRSSTSGGLDVRGIMEGSTSSVNSGLNLLGSSNAATSTKSITGGANVRVVGTIPSDADVAADGNIFGVYKGVGNGDTVAIIDAEGDLWLNGIIDLEGPSDNGYIQAEEITDPGVAAADHGRLYFRDSGAGKTQLVVVFSSGAVQVIAEEP
jgi:hypothetical protein